MRQTNHQITFFPILQYICHTLGVPAVMLREEKDTFLDDMTIEQLGQWLGVKVEVLPTSGGDEAKALLRSGLHIARRRKP